MFFPTRVKVLINLRSGQSRLADRYPTGARDKQDAREQVCERTRAVECKCRMFVREICWSNQPTEPKQQASSLTRKHLAFFNPDRTRTVFHSERAWSALLTGLLKPGTTQPRQAFLAAPTSPRGTSRTTKHANEDTTTSASRSRQELE